MTGARAAIEPYAHGMLQVGDGQRIHWETCGNPEGLPALVLHGGPGSGCTAAARELFDPALFRIILFDQRGCGRSLPHAGDHGTELSTNTTWHLLRDMERLRRHLQVERWLVYGHSWGCTLALAHAEQAPQRVHALILAGVTTTRRREIDWLYRNIAPLFPAEWARFRAGVPDERRDGCLVAAYRNLLGHSDPAVRERAAADWHDWEAASILIDPAASRPRRWSDARYRMARARIVTHYFHYATWLEDGVLLREAHRLAGIPGVMVQGRLDLEAPLVTAWELAQRWPDGQLVVVPGEAHATGSATGSAVMAAIDRLGRIPPRPVDPAATTLHSGTP